MTSNNRNKKTTLGFHTMRISNAAYIAVKNKNVKDYESGEQKTLGETASNMILAGA